MTGHVSPAILEYEKQQQLERQIGLLELELRDKDREISRRDGRIEAQENLLEKFAKRIDELEGGGK